MIAMPGSVPVLSDAAGYVHGTVDPRKPTRRVDVLTPRSTDGVHKRRQPPSLQPEPEPEPEPQLELALGLEPEQAIQRDQERVQLNANASRARAECMALVPPSTENLTALEVELLAKLDEVSTMLCELQQLSHEMLAEKNREICHLRATLSGQKHRPQVHGANAQPPTPLDSSSLEVTEGEASSPASGESTDDSDDSDSTDEHWAMRALCKTTQHPRMAVESSSGLRGGSAGLVESAEGNTAARVQASTRVGSNSRDLARQAGWTSLEQRAWAIAGRDARRLQRIIAAEKDDEKVEECEPPAPPG